MHRHETNNLKFSDLVKCLKQQKSVSVTGGYRCLPSNKDWIKLFTTFFIEKKENDGSMDDLVFFVHNQEDEGHIRQSVRVHRRKEGISVPELDKTVIWEETVYLNIVLQYMEYTLVMAICERTNVKSMKVVQRFDQKVYASPSRRRLDTKGTEEEITYPLVFFMIDNFDEVLSQCEVRENQILYIELVASDHAKETKFSIFRRFIMYETLKKVFLAKNSTSGGWQGIPGLWPPTVENKVEFLSSHGHEGKGRLELAVTKPASTGLMANEFDLRKSQSDSSLGRHLEPSKVTTSAQASIDQGSQSSLNPNATIKSALGHAWGWLTRPRELTEDVDRLRVSLTYVALGCEQIVKDIVDIQRPPKLPT